MKIRTATRGGLASVLLLLPALAAVSAEDWDQARVVVLSQQLLREVSAIKRNISRDWDRDDKQSARYVVIEDLIAIQHKAEALSGLLNAGAGREATGPVFRRVRSSVEHARRDAANFPEIEQQRRHIEAADKVLDELETFYAIPLGEIPAPELGVPPPPPTRGSPPPKVAAAAPDKTFRKRTTVPDPVAGCPQSVMHDVSMNHGGNVRIWVHPAVTGRNEVTSTIGVIMEERAGHFARGDLVERRVVSVPDLPANCQIRRVLTESLASCEFWDDDIEEDSAKCDIVHPDGLVRSLKVSAVVKGLEFDCDDGPGNDAYAELTFNPIEVEVVCE